MREVSKILLFSDESGNISNVRDFLCLLRLGKDYSRNKGSSSSSESKLFCILLTPGSGEIKANKGEITPLCVFACVKGLEVKFESLKLESD